MVDSIVTKNLIAKLGHKSWDISLGWDTRLAKRALDARTLLSTTTFLEHRSGTGGMSSVPRGLAPNNVNEGITKMMQTEELTTQVLARGRQTKFTPERIQQIRNLVERGKSREEIAELIGVTLGSLQVTCSRLGVSLRRPTFNTGTGLLRRGEPSPNGTATHCPGGGKNSGLLQLTKERPEQNFQPGPAGQAQAPTPHQEQAKRQNEAGAAHFAIRMQYKGEERTTELPLTQDMIRQLAFEAELRNMRIGELVGELIIAIMKKDLFQQVLSLEGTRPTQWRS